MGQRFSPHRVDEDQEAGFSPRNWQDRREKSSPAVVAVGAGAASSGYRSGVNFGRAFRSTNRRLEKLGQTYLAIVNPAAGGGRSAKLLAPALERLQQAGIEVKVAATRSPGEATEIARDAYQRGGRNFIAVGGDGTSYEIVNGLFPPAIAEGPPTLAFLPLGTGNSFLRDFSDRGVEHAIESLIARKNRHCDVMMMRLRACEIY